MSNFTSIDTVVNLLEVSLFGSPIILGLFMIAFIVVLLLVARSFTEVAIMIPLPLIVALADAGFLPMWIEPLVWIAAGLYLSVIILIFTGLRR
ncbi:MAG: hypothetical protein IIB81_00370 [Nanoarchaeota archaeon]|nr:hypothetical protein [Nanoarchaeota archaeon]